MIMYITGRVHFGILIKIFLCSQIQNSFVDMENMFDLLSEEPDIVNSPAALPLNVSKGRVEFRNVTFGYLPEKVILRNVSFVVEPGKIVALVRN